MTCLAGCPGCCDRSNILGVGANLFAQKLPFASGENKFAPAQVDQAGREVIDFGVN